jgi:membrane-associated protease RseP (regulator of RpoE activity)
MRSITKTVLARASGHALVAATLLGSFVQPTTAQSRASWMEADRGWIGISFEVVTDGWGRPEYVEITDVSAGSPARAAGLRRGDRLLAINELDRPSELAQLSERLHLRSGDRVAMEIERDGQRRQLELEAARRPEDFQVGSTVEFTLRSDSMVETWVRAMDSLRIELTAENGERVGLRREGRERDDPRTRVRVVRGSEGVGGGSPYEFFVFRGEMHDSLRGEMIVLEQAVSEIESRMEAREQELYMVLGRDAGIHIEDDVELTRLRGELAAVSARTAGTANALADATRSTAGFVPDAPGVASRAPSKRVGADSEYRPLTPYLLGRNRVAGAEVIDLRPELAAYFEVGAGVLVVDVVPGTPAAVAGIVPGDVITRLDQVGVRSVEDLRYGISVAGDSLPISLVRQGSSVQVLLRR